MKNSLLINLYRRPETVFTLKDASLLFPKITYNNLKARLAYYAKKSGIKKLGRGIYAKDGYNPWELANKLYTPSYISLETVLLKAGVIFQPYESIYCASYLTRTVAVAGRTIEYKRLPKTTLVNLEGIEVKDNVMAASPERAFLDAVYLYKDYHFDNLGGLDWNKIDQLKAIYHSRVLSRRVEDYARLR